MECDEYVKTDCDIIAEAFRFSTDMNHRSFWNVGNMSVIGNMR